MGVSASCLRLRRRSPPDPRDQHDPPGAIAIGVAIFVTIVASPSSGGGADGGFPSWMVDHGCHHRTGTDPDVLPDPATCAMIVTRPATCSGAPSSISRGATSVPNRRMFSLASWWLSWPPWRKTAGTDAAHALVERLQLIVNLIRRAGEHRLGVHELLHRRGAMIDWARRCDPLPSGVPAALPSASPHSPRSSCSPVDW